MCITTLSNTTTITFCVLSSLPEDGLTNTNPHRLSFIKSRRITLNTGIYFCQLKEIYLCLVKRDALCYTEIKERLMYSSITTTKSPSFCTKSFSASLTNRTVLLHQSNDHSCYVVRGIVAPPLRWLQKQTDLRASDFAQSPDLWHQPRLANITYAWSWRLCGNNPDLFKWTINSWQDLTSVSYFGAQFSLVFKVSLGPRQIYFDLPGVNTPITFPSFPNPSKWTHTCLIWHKHTPALYNNVIQILIYVCPCIVL